MSAALCARPGQRVRLVWPRRCSGAETSTAGAGPPTPLPTRCCWAWLSRPLPEPRYSTVESALHLVASRVGKPWAPWTPPRAFWEPGGAAVSVRVPTGDTGGPEQGAPRGLITRGTGYGVPTRGSAGPRTATTPRYRGQGERAEWDPGGRGQGQKPLLWSSDRQQGDRASRGPPDRSSPSLWSPVGFPIG